MSNIKNLQMWRNICADVRVSIGHSFFGLKTTATYIPTDSVIDARTIDYSQQDSLFMHADTFKIFTFNIRTDSVCM